jgi:hypothetical protein
MAKRDNHYEAAFEAWLRSLRVPYVAVNEAHRALATTGGGRERSLKSLDFLVSPPQSRERWLIDIKGRHFPTAGHQYWRNWSTTDELESLANWELLMGPRATALLVFAYNIIGDRAPLPPEELFVHRGSLYGFVGIRLDHYTGFARQLSRRWKTVTVSVPQFRMLARPARELMGISLPAAAGGAPATAQRSA